MSETLGPNGGSVSPTATVFCTRIERLGTLRHLSEPCEIPEPVYAEVVEAGLDEGHPDARRLERCVEDGVLDRVAVEETPLAARLRENENLSDADVAVDAHADATDGVAVMDETYGRDVAATEGVTTRGTAFLVLRLAREGGLTPGEARETVDAMVDEGWYCAPDLYAKIVRTIDSMDG